MPNLPSFFSSVVTYLNPPIGEHSIYDHVQTIRWYRFLKCIHIKMAWNPNWYDGNWYGKMYLNYHLQMKIAQQQFTMKECFFLHLGVTHREYLKTFTTLVNTSFHVRSVQFYRVKELTTAHSHFFACSFKAASCAKKRWTSTDFSFDSRVFISLYFWECLGK